MHESSDSDSYNGPQHLTNHHIITLLPVKRLSATTITSTNHHWNGDVAVGRARDMTSFEPWYIFFSFFLFFTLLTIYEINERTTRERRREKAQNTSNDVFWSIGMFLFSFSFGYIHTNYVFRSYLTFTIASIATSQKKKRTLKIKTNMMTQRQLEHDKLTSEWRATGDRQLPMVCFSNCDVLYHRMPKPHTQRHPYCPQ